MKTIAFGLFSGGYPFFIRSVKSPAIAAPDQILTVVAIPFSSGQLRVRLL